MDVKDSTMLMEGVVSAVGGMVFLRLVSLMASVRVASVSSTLMICHTFSSINFSYSFNGTYRTRSNRQCAGSVVASGAQSSHIVFQESSDLIEVFPARAGPMDPKHLVIFR